MAEQHPKVATTADVEHGVPRGASCVARGATSPRLWAHRQRISWVALPAKNCVFRLAEGQGAGYRGRLRRPRRVAEPRVGAAGATSAEGVPPAFGGRGPPHRRPPKIGAEGGDGAEGPKAPKGLIIGAFWWECDHAEVHTQAAST